MSALRNDDAPHSDAGNVEVRKDLGLADATTYEDWKHAALQEDQHGGGAAWRKEDRSSRYDYQAIRRRYNQITALKAADDPHALLFYLNEGIHGNTGGIGKPSLYNRAKFGTKDDRKSTR